MRAARLTGPRTFELVTTERPEPAPDEVLFAVEGCGVCGSNLPPWSGDAGMEFPFAPGALGHEAWGRIEAVGDAVQGLERGQRIAALSYRAFAEYDVARAADVLVLPGVLAEGPVPGEPVACAVNVAERSAVQEGDTVVILGAGFLGLLVQQLVLEARPAHVIAVSRRPVARALAERLGAGAAVGWGDVDAEVRARTGGEGADVVIEATGAQRGLDLGGELCRVRGRLVVAGYHQGGRRSIDMQLWNWRGLDVINAHERAQERYRQGMRRGIERMADGRLEVAPLVTHTLPLEEIGRAFELADERPVDFMKSVVEGVRR